MAKDPAYPNFLMGQCEDCQTFDVAQTGILQDVRPDRIVLEMPFLSNATGQKDFKAEHIDRYDPVNSYLTQFFFTPFYSLL